MLTSTKTHGDEKIRESCRPLVTAGTVRQRLVEVDMGTPDQRQGSIFGREVSGSGCVCKGARERMRRLGMQQRCSVPSLHAALAAEASAALGLMKGSRVADELHAPPLTGRDEPSVRGSCPTGPLCASGTPSQ